LVEFSSIPPVDAWVVATEFGVPQKVVVVVRIDQIPKLRRGKGVLDTAMKLAPLA
jgi:hypothetical protein